MAKRNGRHASPQKTSTIYGMPTHFKRICSVIDELPTDLDFELSQQSELQFPEESRLSQELEGYHLSQQSNADSVSLLEKDDSESSFVGPQDITPDTSLSQRTGRGAFKKPKKRRGSLE